jgi:hypothetical protein
LHGTPNRIEALLKKMLDVVVNDNY